MWTGSKRVTYMGIWIYGSLGRFCMYLRQGFAPAAKWYGGNIYIYIYIYDYVHKKNLRMKTFFLGAKKKIEGDGRNFWAQKNFFAPKDLGTKKFFLRTWKIHSPLFFSTKFFFPTSAQKKIFWGRWPKFLGAFFFAPHTKKFLCIKPAYTFYKIFCVQSHIYICMTIYSKNI